MLTAALRDAIGSDRTASPAGARLAPSSSAGRSDRLRWQSRETQSEFKNRRKSRSRRGDEAEVFLALKSASSRRRLPFLDTACRAKLNPGLMVDTRTVSLRQ